MLVTTATGSYNRFVDPLIESARRYFLAGEAYEVFYVVFSDQVRTEASAHARVSYVYRKDLGWPLTAMMRYRSFLDSWHLLAHASFLFRSLDSQRYPVFSPSPGALIKKAPSRKLVSCLA